MFFIAKLSLAATSHSVPGKGTGMTYYVRPVHLAIHGREAKWPVPAWPAIELPLKRPVEFRGHEPNYPNSHFCAPPLPPLPWTPPHFSHPYSNNGHITAHGRLPLIFNGAMGSDLANPPGKNKFILFTLCFPP